MKIYKYYFEKNLKFNVIVIVIVIVIVRKHTEKIY